MTTPTPDPFATPANETSPGISQQPLHLSGPQSTTSTDAPSPAPAYAPTPGYMGMTGQQEHPQGTLILILGILGFFVGLSGPVAWVMGNKALKEIDAAPGMYSNRGNVVAGRVCGIIVTIFMIVTVVLMILAIIAILVFAKDMPTTGTTY